MFGVGGSPGNATMTVDDVVYYTRALTQPEITELSAP